MQERVNAHRDLADHFIQRVLGLEDAWISDESSLWDFHTDETNQHLRAVFRFKCCDLEIMRGGIFLRKTPLSAYVSLKSKIETAVKRR